MNDYLFKLSSSNTIHMVYPKIIHVITTYEEYLESPQKLNEIWTLISRINDIESVYLTVLGSDYKREFVNDKDFPYLVTYIKENGIEELHTREYAHIKAPDLIVKTGAPRLSNVLLWHTVYSEYYFTMKPLKKLNIRRLHKNLRNFNKHKRTFGM